MTVKEVPLCDLHENDYNPRKHFDDAAMADLRESIESEGLNQALTVRPAEENGSYEVVSGMRRLKALREIHGDDADESIPCNVQDVDDEDAPWKAFSENKWREDLTPYEEALFFGERIEVEYREDDNGEPIRESYSEYLDAVRAVDRSVDAPSAQHPSVKQASERTGVDSSTLALRRLWLLVLPPESQKFIEQGELGPSEARLIAPLRQIPNADRRNGWMNQLADEYAVDNPDRDALRDAVQSKLDKDEREREKREAQIEEYENLVTERESELRVVLTDAVETFNDEHDDELELGPEDVEDIDESADDAFETYVEAFVDDPADEADDKLRARSQHTIGTLGDVRSSLRSEALDELNDEQDEKQLEKGRLEQNIETARDEGLSRCPYCKSGLHIPDLEDRVAEYETEIEALTERKQEVSAVSKALDGARSDLRTALNEYDDAIEKLQSEKEKAGGGG